MKKLAIVAAVACFSVAAWSARADVITLSDGTVIQGSIHKTDTGYVITDSTGKQTTVQDDQIKSIALTPHGAAPSSGEHLDSLRNSVQSMTDLSQIISRYQQFIAQYPTGAEHDAAVKDLATWQDRATQGMVRVGDSWVTPAQAQQTHRQNSQALQPVLQEIATGQNKEAAAALQPILAADPRNEAALYLRGLVRYALAQLPQARADFQAVVAVNPNNGAAMNNIAVIYFQQKQFGPSFNFLCQAMTAAPVNQTILDNVAEAINDAPPELKNSVIVLKMQHMYGDQEQSLEQKMSAQGKLRYGSGWVSQQQLDQINQQQAATDSKANTLQQQFNVDQAQLAQMNQAINNNEYQQSQYVQPQQPSLPPVGQTVQGRNGTWTNMQTGPINSPQTPDPQLAAQHASLINQRDQLMQQIADLRNQAAVLQRNPGSNPKFSGQLQLIGPEGVASLAGSTTRPAGVIQAVPPPLPPSSYSTDPSPAVPAPAPLADAPAPGPTIPRTYSSESLWFSYTGTWGGIPSEPPAATPAPAQSTIPNPPPRIRPQVVSGSPS